MEPDIMPFPWTAAAVVRLRELLAEGISASSIALILSAEFGAELTRNAVIGKVHRIHAEFQSRPAVTGVQRAYSRHRAAGIARSPRVRFQLKRKLMGPTPPLNVGAVKMGVARPRGNPRLVELAVGECRWPLGETLSPAKVFCGKPVVPGYAYCAPHCGRAYQLPGRINGMPAWRLALLRAQNGGPGQQAGHDQRERDQGGGFVGEGREHGESPSLVADRGDPSVAGVKAVLTPGVRR